MTDQAQLLKTLKLAGQRRVRAETARKTAAVELRERILEAHAAGVPISRIAHAAGLSRQGVYDVLRAGNGQPPS